MSLNLPASDHIFNVSQEHLAVALNQVSLGFWEVNLTEGNTMTCTDQCKRNFGWDPKETFAYEAMLACIVPEDRPQMQEAIARAIMHHTLYFAQYRIKHPDDSIHWIEARGSVIYHDERPQKIIGTTVDITETKDLEILRDELLDIAMHELKTPLSAVKGSLQLLERHLQQAADSKMLEIAMRALGSTERITRLLNDMAKPVIVQAREIVLVKTAFDLRKLADEIVENAVMLYPDKNIVVHSEKEQVTATADRYRIGQVLTNLVNNAIKYSPEAPDIDIYISQDEHQSLVRVKDKGLGIAPEERSKVFRKYYRSHTRRSIDGLGIGLFVCSEILLRHGGTIAVEDTEEPGTIVYFTLPT